MIVLRNGHLSFFLAATLLTSCASNREGGVHEIVSEPVAMQRELGDDHWQGKDLASGPVSLVKAPLAVITCPLRLISKTITGATNSTSDSKSIAGELFLMPVRAVVDGAFTGAGYAIGGAIDTVSGGTAGVVESATSEEQPNTNLHCILAGQSGD